MLLRFRVYSIFTEPNTLNNEVKYFQLQNAQKITYFSNFIHFIDTLIEPSPRKDAKKLLLEICADFAKIQRI